jgi:heptosyltransferase-2
VPNPSSIFVLRNNDVGDVLVVTPLFDALRRRFPAARIVAGVGDWNRPVFEGNPHVDEVLSVNAPWWNKYTKRQGWSARWYYLVRSPELRVLRAQRFDLGIDVLGSTWGALLLLRAGIPWRLGMRGFAGGHSAAHATVHYDPNEHVGRSALRFAELLGSPSALLPPATPQLYPRPDELRAAEEWWMQGGGQTPISRRVLMAPGGGLADRRWPIERYATLAKLILRQPAIRLALVGGLREEQLVARVVGEAPSVRRLANPPSLREVFALVATCDVVVSNSSMTMHVAAAFGKQSVVLLGRAYSSAVRHQAQWGYSSSCSLGPESGVRSEVCSVEEALQATLDALAAAPRAHYTSPGRNL